MDKLDSGLGISALARSNALPEIDVIPALDFSSPGALLKRIHSGSYSTVIFSWRFLAWELLSMRRSSRVLAKIARTAKITVLIPDHLGMENFLREREQRLLDVVDGYFVSSKILFDWYQKMHPENFLGVIHDLPNVDLIRSLRKASLFNQETHQIIWIGNSQWGRKYGFEDHKGLKCVVLPLKSELPPGYELIEVDSGQRALSNREVLELLARSQVLIQPSASEGTGLPVLEAAGLGVVPVSTCVGIAPELLDGELQNLIVDRNVDDFLVGVLWAVENRTWISNQLINRFEKFVKDSLTERMEVDLSLERKLGSMNESFSMRVNIRIKWSARFVKNLYAKSKR